MGIGPTVALMCALAQVDASEPQGMALEKRAAWRAAQRVLGLEGLRDPFYR